MKRLLLFDPGEASLNGEPDELIRDAGCFSSGEQILVRVAIDIWNGCGGASLGDVLTRLDDWRFRRVVRAMLNARAQESGRTDRRQLKFPICKDTFRQ